MITTQTNQPARRTETSSSSPQSPQLRPSGPNIADGAMTSKSEFATSAPDASAVPVKEMIQKNKKWRTKSAVVRDDVEKFKEIDVIKDLFDASSIKQDFQRMTAHSAHFELKAKGGKNKNQKQDDSLLLSNGEQQQQWTPSQFAEFNHHISKNITPTKSSPTEKKGPSPRKSKKKSPRSGKSKKNRENIWNLQHFEDYSTNAQGAAVLASIGASSGYYVPYCGLMDSRESSYYGHHGTFGDSPTEMSSSVGPYEETNPNFDCCGYGYCYEGSAAAAAASAYQYYHSYQQHPAPSAHPRIYPTYYPYYVPYAPEYYRPPPQWDGAEGCSGSGDGEATKSEKKLNVDAPSFEPKKIVQ